jgi:hypothetical protein
MDCHTFERLLPDFQHSLLKDDLRQEAESHLRDCPECRLLLTIWKEHPEPPPDMTLDILARTSGSACPRLREQACAFVDDELDEATSVLAQGHLDHCETCSALVATLMELNSVLPTMACLDPGPSFTQEVLRRTVRVPVLDPWADFLAFWRRLFRRPRFCIEAAYAGTLAGVLVLNVPLPRLQSDKGTLHMMGTIRTKELLPPVLNSAKNLAAIAMRFEQRGVRSIQDSFQRGRKGLLEELHHQGKNLDEMQEHASKDFRSWLQRLGMKTNSEETTEPSERSSRSSS